MNPLFLFTDPASDHSFVRSFEISVRLIFVSGISDLRSLLNCNFFIHKNLLYIAFKIFIVNSFVVLNFLLPESQGLRIEVLCDHATSILIYYLRRILFYLHYGLICIDSFGNDSHLIIDKSHIFGAICAFQSRLALYV